MTSNKKQSKNKEIMDTKVPIINPIEDTKEYLKFNSKDFWMDIALPAVSIIFIIKLLILLLS